MATLATAAFDRAIFGRGKHPTTLSSENFVAKVYTPFNPPKLNLNLNLNLNQGLHPIQPSRTKPKPKPKPKPRSTPHSTSKLTAKEAY